MIRRQFLCVALALFGLVFSSAAAPAAEDVLTVIPDDALGFVVVNKIGPMHGKVMKMSKTLQLPAKITETLKSLRKQAPQALDKRGSVAVAAVVDSQTPGAPVAVGFVPTTDYQALMKQLNAADSDAKIAEVMIGNKKTLVAQKGAFAVLTRQGNEQILEQVLASTDSAAAAAARLKGQLAGCDIYAVAMPGGIKMAQQGLLVGLAAGKAKMAQEGGPQAEMALRGIGIYEELFKAMDKEITHTSVGLQIQKDGGLRIVSRTLLAPDGTIAKLAKTVGPPAENPLGGLPREPFMFAGGGLYPGSWAKELAGFSIKFMEIYMGADGLTDEHAKKFAELSAQSLKGMRSMSMLMGVSGPDESLYSNMLVTIEVDDSKKYLANYERVVREMGKIGKEANVPFLSFDVEKTEVEGTSALKMAMDLSAMLGGQQDPNAKKAIEAMLGTSGKLDVYLAAADSDTVVVAYVSEQRLVEALEVAKNPDRQLSADPSIAKAAAELPSDAQWIAFWSPRGTFEFAANMIGKIAPEAQGKIPAFPKTSPVAFAERLSTEGVDIEIQVPADLIKAISEFIGTVKAKQQAP